MESFQAILDSMTTSREALARDLQVPAQAVHSWYRRDRIPSRYWAEFLALAPAHGVQGLCAAGLVRLAARKDGIRAPMWAEFHPVRKPPKVHYCRPAHRDGKPNVWMFLCRPGHVIGASELTEIKNQNDCKRYCGNCLRLMR